MNVKVNSKAVIKIVAFCFLLITKVLIAKAQQPYEVKKSEVIYKEIDGNKLEMNVYAPSMQKQEKLPAIVFFYGGGWNSSNMKQFDLQARYLASRGMVVFCPEYRYASKHKTKVVECVKDSRSAVRYIKSHADEFGIKQDQIIAAGISAGGHLSAALATINEFNESTDDLKISVNPYALVLIVPALRIDSATLNPAAVPRFDGKEEALSPYNHIKKNMPPTLIMAGVNDDKIPLQSLRDFTKKMEQFGNSCKLIEYPGKGHNLAHFMQSPDSFKASLADMEKFLDKLIKFKTPSWLDEYVASLPRK